MKNSSFVIACGPKGNITPGAIQALTGHREKTPTLTIPCAIGDHDECTGVGCECPCNHKHL